MEMKRSSAEVAALVWLASAAVAGLALDLSGGAPVWAAVVGAVSGGVAFWAVGGMEPIDP